MARQRESGIVAASRRLSDTQGAFQDRGEQFFAGYNKAMENKKAREDKNKETQTRVNNLMGQFKNDIDVLKFKPEDQALVKNSVASWRNEYAEAANAAGKIQDKSSPEYQQYVDVMNNVKNKMANLKGNLDNLAAFKGEYSKNIKAGHYSNAGANDMSLAQGEVMLQYPIGSIGENGDLMWNDEAGGGEFGFQDYQMPFEKATGLATALGAIADPLLTQKTPLNEIQKSGIREQVSSLLSDKNALASILSESDLPEFDFSNIDPDDPNAKQQATDLIVNSIESLRGSGIVPDKKEEQDSDRMISKRLVPTYRSMMADQEAITQAAMGVTPREVNKAYNLGTASRPFTIKATNDGWTVEDVSSGLIESYVSLQDLQISNPNLFK